jgi:6-phosphogluconolactonase (cycloisomerase 2 family)
MRMKFNKSRQLLLVSAVSLLAAGLMTACGTDTTDFVYVTSAKAAGPNNYGEINVFEINKVSGAMRQIPSSPFFSEGRNPVAEAVSSDYADLYVVNQDDNTIVQFFIGSDGKLYPQSTVNTPGLYPLAVAVNGSNLFVLDTYQPESNCSTAAPCSGSVSVFPIDTTSRALGKAITNADNGANYWPLALSSSPSDILLPTAINVVKSGKYAYVTAYDTSVTPNRGYIFGFAVGAGGVLTPLANSPFAITGGVRPSAIASDFSSGYLYVTDWKSGNVHAYAVAASSGDLSEISGSPFAAGNQPSTIVVDPNYSFAYVANAQDGNISAYSIGSNGSLTSIGTYTAGVQPMAIGIDPSTSHFLFTANYLSGNVSGFELNTTTGTLTNSQRSPFASNAQPTAVAAVPHK